jgi:GNAT superfamily N-acetyltransferase
MTNKIALAESDEEITNCFAVMAELRPHIKSDKFLPTVKRLIANAGFRMAYLSDGEVKAVAGFRISEWLSGGRYLEIEDLAAKSGERSKGYGGELFDWLVKYANNENCRHLKLVSNVTRFGAHRFYLNKRMNIGAHYFTLDLEN